MKAVQFSEYGSPDVLHVAKLPLPEAAPNMLRIKVAAVGVNPADFKWRQGMFKDIMPVRLPHTLGYDIAGIVDAVGEGVADLSVGDRVFGMLDAVTKGGYAEYAVCTENHIALIPDGLGFAAAAVLPTAGLTGFQMIDEQLKPKAGQRVLITGAVGAVGRFALFAAHRRGAEIVAAVRASHRDEARKLGAAHVIVLGEDDWNGAPFDHIADTVGGPAVALLCKKLAPGGLIRTVSTTPIDPEGLPAEPVFFGVHPDRKALEDIGRLAAKGELTLPVARRMPLAEAAQAHRLVETGGAGGKIILEP